MENNLIHLMQFSGTEALAKSIGILVSRYKSARLCVFLPSTVPSISSVCTSCSLTLRRHLLLWQASLRSLWTRVYHGETIMEACSAMNWIPELRIYSVRPCTSSPKGLTCVRMWYLIWCCRVFLYQQSSILHCLIVIVKTTLASYIRYISVIEIVLLCRPMSKSLYLEKNCSLTINNN